jgi:hypothetical protein
LLDRQERVLGVDGEHCRPFVETSRDLDTIVGPGRRRLAGITQEGKVGSVVVPLTRPGSWYRRSWVVSLATAASALVAVIAFDRARDRGSVAAAGWGWSRPGALLEGVPRSAYLDQLADAARDWFKKRPADATALARRIGESRQGCSTLIRAEHRPLSAENRDWLVGKCRDWAARLDTHLRAVEAGEAPTKILGEADETVEKLIRALRNRATESA